MKKLLVLFLIFVYSGAAFCAGEGGSNKRKRDAFKGPVSVKQGELQDAVEIFSGAEQLLFEASRSLYRFGVSRNDFIVLGSHLRVAADHVGTVRKRFEEKFRRRKRQNVGDVDRGIIGLQEFLSRHGCGEESVDESSGAPAGERVCSCDDGNGTSEEPLSAGTSVADTHIDSSGRAFSIFNGVREST